MNNVNTVNTSEVEGNETKGIQWQAAGLELSESANEKVVELLMEESNPKLKLRAFVQGGGCAGFSYGFTFDEEVNADDHVLNFKGITVLVDALSMQYLQGATIDYKEELTGSSFVIKNPNAVSTCGCGSSFSI